MPQIPQVDTFIPGNTPSGNLRVPGNLGQNVGAAIAGLGQSIEGLGDDAQKMAQLQEKVQLSTDSALLAKADAEMDSTIKDWEAWTKTNPDTNGWQEQLDTMMEGTKKNISTYSSKLSPQAKTHLSGMTDVWGIKSKSTLKWKSIENQLEENQAIFNTQMDSAAANNDADAMRKYVDVFVANGTVKQKVADARLKANLQLMNKNLYHQWLAEDAFMKVDDIFTMVEKHTGEKISPAVREVLEKEQSKVQAKERTDFISELNRMRGPLGTDPLPDIDQKLPSLRGGDGSIASEMNRMGIKPETVKKMYSGKPEFDQEVSNAIDREINDIPPEVASDPADPSTANAVRFHIYSSNLPPQEQTRLLTRLEELSNTKSNVNGQAVQDWRRRANEMYDNGEFVPASQYIAGKKASSIFGVSIGKDTEEAFLQPEAMKDKTDKWRKVLTIPQILETEKEFSSYMSQMNAWIKEETQRKSRPLTYDEISVKSMELRTKKYNEVIARLVAGKKSDSATASSALASAKSEANKNIQFKDRKFVKQGGVVYDVTDLKNPFPVKVN